MEMVKVGFSIFISWVIMIFGGWDTLFIILLALMVIDIITGAISGFMGKSDKSENGYISSSVGFHGLLKKCTMLLCVIIGTILDIVMHLNIVRNAVVTFFILNELNSIIENMGIIGIPIPEAIKKHIDTLNKEEKESGTKTNLPS